MYNGQVLYKGELVSIVCSSDSDCGIDIITIEGKFGRKDVFEDELVFNLDTISKFIRNGKEKI